MGGPTASRAATRGATRGAPGAARVGRLSHPPKYFVNRSASTGLPSSARRQEAKSRLRGVRLNVGQGGSGSCFLQRSGRPTDTERLYWMHWPSCQSRVKKQVKPPCCVRGSRPAARRPGSAPPLHSPVAESRTSQALSQDCAVLATLRVDSTSCVVEQAFALEWSWALDSSTLFLSSWSLRSAWRAAREEPKVEPPLLCIFPRTLRAKRRDCAADVTFPRRASPPGTPRRTRGSAVPLPKTRLPDRREGLQEVVLPGHLLEGLQRRSLRVGNPRAT